MTSRSHGRGTPSRGVRTQRRAADRAAREAPRVMEVPEALRRLADPDPADDTNGEADRVQS